MSSKGQRLNNGIEGWVAKYAQHLSLGVEVPNLPTLIERECWKEVHSGILECSLHHRYRHLLTSIDKSLVNDIKWVMHCMYFEILLLFIFKCP